MAILDELVSQIENFDLRTRIAVEVEKLAKQKNDRRKQSIENVHEDRQINGSYLAWDRTCAAMDRLEDTILYLNQMELGKDTGFRSAFDFYDFINNAYVVIECIKTAGRIHLKVDPNGELCCDQLKNMI